MSRRSKILLVVAGVGLPLVAIVSFGVGSYLWIRSRSPELNPVGTVLSAQRKTFMVNSTPFVGSSCPYKEYSLGGDALGSVVDGESLNRALESAAGTYETFSDGFVEGAEFVQIDAETETVVTECLPVVPDPKPRRTTALRITKLYSVTKAAQGPRY